MTANQQATIGLGILSWRGYESLRRSLQTYREHDLFSLFDECTVFLPEIEQTGVALAQEFGLAYAGSEKNLGILGGFQALAKTMTTDYILLCENDYGLVENQASARDQIARGLEGLKNQMAAVWRFRHRHQPGEVWAIEKGLRYWPRDEAPVHAKFLAGMRRVLRPDKAARLKWYAAFIYDDLEQRFPDVVRKTPAGDLLVRSDVMNWSNNPFLIDRTFFLDTIIPAALEQAGGRLINGFPTIETELNRGWWRDQKYWVGLACPGLFSHARFGDRGY